ncbi:hypothetical protein [Serratia fonticola]|uniref:hypothetical protein n=1 Tax=Serratia fonticola TaxID=47917 RepID=UPI0034C6CA45
MSLESNLELNNKLVAEQNTLLTQLLAAMTSGKTFTADTPHQPKAEGSTVGKAATGETKPRKGPFYIRLENGPPCIVDSESTLAAHIEKGYTEITKVEYLQLQEEASKATTKPITLEELPLPNAIALAVLEGEAGRTPTFEQLAAAEHVANTATGKERNEQVDALTMALKGVDLAAKLHGAGVFELTLQMVEHWDALPGITERREYATLLLNTPVDKRAKVKPKTSKKLEEKSTDTEGTIDVAALHAKGKQLILQKIAAKAPADLRKTLDLFGLKKLTECPDDKLPDVVAALEQLAESLEA